MRRSGTALAALLAGFLVTGPVTGLAGAATAQPVAPKEARKLLFKGSKITVQLLEPEGVDAAIMEQVEKVADSLTDPKITELWKGMGFSLAYYGAIAIVPDRPVDPSKTMSISNSLHSPQAAANAAVRACRELSGADCVAAALILPRRYKPRELTLSQAASDGFRENWGKPDVPQYLAYSQATGVWLIARGAGADQVALERCNERAGEDALVSAPDCLIAIAEE